LCDYCCVGDFSGYSSGGSSDHRAQSFHGLDAIGLHTPQAEANAGHRGAAMYDPAQTFSQAQVMHGCVALGIPQHLFVSTPMNSARRGAAEDRVNHPHPRLTPPDRRQVEDISQSRKPQTGRRSDLLELSDHRGADAIIAHQGVAEADHEGRNHGRKNP
jgi:hypothetical protein